MKKNKLRIRRTDRAVWCTTCCYWVKGYRWRQHRWLRPIHGLRRVWRWVMWTLEHCGLAGAPDKAAG